VGTLKEHLLRASSGIEQSPTDHAHLLATRHNELVGLLLETGRRFAVSEGVPSREIDDCAAIFMEKMFLDADGSDLSAIQGRSVGWLMVCARNHARNYRRGVQRIARHMAQLPLHAIQLNSEAGRPDRAACPEDALLRAEEWGYVIQAIDTLHPNVQRMFVAYYVVGETLIDISARTGRTPHAVEQALYRARSRIRAYLIETGFRSD
jgi:RNA polymerase sigma factor (sigma-70 family)